MGGERLQKNSGHYRTGGATNVTPTANPAMTHDIPTMGFWSNNRLVALKSITDKEDNPRTKCALKIVAVDENARPNFVQREDPHQKVPLFFLNFYFRK